jgi:spore germination protein YaaH
LNPNLYTKKVLAFGTYYYYGSQETYNSLLTNYKSIDELATDTFATDGNGNLIAGKGYNSSGNLVDLIPTNQIAFVNSRNIPVYAMITNGFNADTARSVLRSPQNVQNLISNTLSVLRTNNYSGVNVDMEGIYASDRIYFSQFVQALSLALKANNYTITVAVPAKTYDSLTDGWTGGYDYNEISKYADEIAIMTYDEHWSGGTPGPIASIDWVDRVIKYSITSIPKNKILLGLASYGYDWGTNGQHQAYTIDQAYNKASSMGANVIFDSLSKSSHYDYVDQGVQHSVWFENADSISYKLDLVNSYDLKGIAIWSLSQTNAAYFNTINSKLNKAF